MANPTWPASLPQTPYLPSGGTPKYVAADNTVRTDNLAGPAKLRRKYTAVPETTTITLQLTSAQLATLNDFAKTTLEDVLPFDWIDFRTGNAGTYRLPHGRSSITEQWDSADMWTVNLELELLP